MNAPIDKKRVIDLIEAVVGLAGLCGILGALCWGIWDMAKTTFEQGDYGLGIALISVFMVLVALFSTMIRKGGL